MARRGWRGGEWGGWFVYISMLHLSIDQIVCVAVNQTIKLYMNKNVVILCVVCQREVTKLLHAYIYSLIKTREAKKGPSHRSST